MIEVWRHADRTCETKLMVWSGVIRGLPAALLTIGSPCQIETRSHIERFVNLYRRCRVQVCAEIPQDLEEWRSGVGSVGFEDMTYALVPRKPEVVR